MKKAKIKSIIFISIISVSIIANGILSILYINEKSDNKKLNNNITILEKDLKSKNEEIEQNKIDSDKNEEIKQEEKQEETTKPNNNSNQNTTKPNNNQSQTTTTTTKPVEVNPLVGKWQYVNGEDVSTYEFKNDGTLWINDEYIDKYTDKTAICDNCLTHIGLHEIQFMIKDGYLYINFYKETERRDLNHDGVDEENVYWLISLGSYVKANKIG